MRPAPDHGVVDPSLIVPSNEEGEEENQLQKVCEVIVSFSDKNVEKDDEIKPSQGDNDTKKGTEGKSPSKKKSRIRNPLRKNKDHRTPEERRTAKRNAVFNGTLGATKG